ncbi:LmrA/YxaF family transcription factor [Rhodococcus qingshengii]|uniref:LmrA/YxaF family transcription factor n=1 Tax=Rhodococcus qingshengii TaxID=334542 RepID=UPI003D12B7CF
MRIARRSLPVEAGCPAASAAIVGAPHDHHLQPAIAAILQRWHRLLLEAMTAGGIEPQRTVRFTTMAIATVEDPVILCRINRSVAALHKVKTQLELLVTNAIPTHSNGHIRSSVLINSIRAPDSSGARRGRVRVIASRPANGTVER